MEEYIPGDGLDYQISRQVLTEEETRDIALQLCAALEVIHTQEPIIIHRDIKASNVMVKPDGVVKLIDFDAARNYHEEQDRDTQQMGTLEYASPEHFGYAQTDEKSDIYSVGILMHEMLTGETLSQENITYKGKLRRIICKCTRVNANKRYHSVRQLKRKLISQRHYRRRCVIAAVLMMCIFVSAAGVTVHYYRQKEVQQAPEKKTKEELEREAFNKRFAAFDREKGNLVNLIKDEYVIGEIDKILGNDTSYFLNNFDNVKGFYDEKEKAYIIAGSRMEEDYTVRKDVPFSVIVIRDNGNIQCGYVKAIPQFNIFFKANAEEEYHKLPESIITWIIDKILDGFTFPVEGQEYLQQYEVNEKERAYNLAGDYILRSLDGHTGEIHISKSSKKDKELKCYKIRGTVSDGEEEREINIEVANDMIPIYYYVNEKRKHEIIMRFFHDSILLAEYYKGELKDSEKGITVTGQYIKENESEKNNR